MIAEKRTFVAVWPLAMEISWDCGNLFSYMLLKLKYNGNFNHFTQIVHSNAHLNPLKGISNDKPLIIAEILNFQFAEIFNSKET